MEESALIEKAMNRKGHPAADPKDAAVEIRAGPKVGDGAQELRSVALFLQRVGAICRTHNAQIAGLHLPLLASSGRGHQCTLDLDSGTSEDLLNERRTGQGGIHHDLNALESGAVADF